MLLLLALCTTAHAETYSCNSCSDCTTKIDSAAGGDVVQLTTDVASADGNCVTFAGKTGVSFDCQGNTLEGNLTDYGIYLNTGSGNTVKNCVVTSYSHGIHLYNSDGNTIRNNTANSNRFIGIYALSSDENTFDENVASYNSGGGGIFLAYCQGNSITNNEADHNSEYGIELYFSGNSTLTANTASSNRYGIYFMYSSDNTANLNYACGQNASDFYIGGTSINSGDDNTCTTDGGWNDTGTNGCTYGCSGTTTTSTTTTTTSTTTTVTLPENMCWSEDMGFLYRTKYQARKFCKCATGTYGYESYSESSGERATYSYIDTGDNDNWETSCSDEYHQIFRVKCTDNIWYYTNEDYFIPTSSTSTSTSSTSTAASSTTTSTSMPCSLAGDYPPCGEITLAEIVAHINLWAAGEVPLAEVVALVNAWASQA